MSAGQGEARIVSLQLCVGHREPMRMVESALAIAGFGIEGDRHAVSQGPRTARQVLLMDGHILEGLGLAHGDVRENITTAGVELASLAEGRRLALGEEVVLRITAPCEPCSRMDEIRPGLQRELEARRGMLATVAKGGTIRVGDGVRVLAGAQTAS